MALTKPPTLQLRAIDHVEDQSEKKRKKKRKEKKKFPLRVHHQPWLPFRPPASNTLWDPAAVLHSCLSFLYPAGVVLYTPNPLRVARVNGSLRSLYPYSPPRKYPFDTTPREKGYLRNNPQAGPQDQGPPSSAQTMGGAVTGELQATCCEDRNSRVPIVCEVELNVWGFDEKGHSELVKVVRVRSRGFAVWMSSKDAALRSLSRLLRRARKKRNWVVCGCGLEELEAGLKSLKSMNGAADSAKIPSKERDSKGREIWTSRKAERNTKEK
ncbi:hypothetical protein C8R47DRAFT_1079929 [Mycena vitilis]|nr:hypothetical protein C8R47DRAFT_1079929 [Mycena vitilis]